MATPKNSEASTRTMARPKQSDSLFNLNEIAKLVTVAGVVLVPIYGYFNLQRNTSDNTAALAEFRAGSKDSKDEQRRQTDELKKQISDAQEKQAAGLAELLKKLSERMEEDEKLVREINSNGTQYGRNKVDVRMEKIARVSARVDTLEKVFGDIRTKLDRIDDHVEQMWGDYNYRISPGTPHVEVHKLPRN